MGPARQVSPPEPDPGALDRLADLLGDGGCVVLTGAGVSTDSGVPDYRGPDGVRHARAPMTLQDFVGDPLARSRYWAGSTLGWRRMRAARPNVTHRALATLERAGLLDAVVTQNVDGLHTAAGSGRVLELHGSLAEVVCLACGDRTPRAAHTARLEAANPGLLEQAQAAAVAPDGDVRVAPRDAASFQVVPCERCGSGPLKPDVVFFGETVPAARVTACADLVREAGSLLVLGSSLSVMSGYRLVLRAREHGVPVAVVNRGWTRADARVDVRVDAPLAAALPPVLARLGLTAA